MIIRITFVRLAAAIPLVATVFVTAGAFGTTTMYAGFDFWAWCFSNA